MMEIGGRQGVSETCDRWGAHARRCIRGVAKLFVGEAGPNRGARGESLDHFAAQVAELSGEDMSLDIQWGGALFKAGATVSGIADGVADMGTIIAV